MKSDYAFFYLEGRDEKRLRADIDTEAIAKDVLNDKGTIHELVHKAVTAAAETHRVDRKKRQWIEEYAEDIQSAGGDGEEAYRHYLDGRIDELTHTLEGEVVDDMTALIGGEDDEDDDDEDEEEDET
jgi:hypothetical protein